MTTQTETTTPEITRVPKPFNLFDEMAKVDLTVPRNQKPVPEGERVLGVLSETLIRIGCVMQSIREKAEAFREEALREKKAHDALHDENPDVDEKLCDESNQKAHLAIAELRDLSAQNQLVREIFFDLVRLEFALLDSNGSLLVCEGDKVVFIKDEVGFDLLAMLLGEDQGGRMGVPSGGLGRAGRFES